MGMSASQARFLSLTARKNNVEFHGQQINQQRTTLSNESANYYSELCNLSVPIPPSIDDYTNITYTFDDGAVKNTLISLYPDRKGGARNKYIVNYTESWKDDYAIVPVHSSMVETDNPSNPTRYSIGNQVLRVAGQAPAAANEDVYYSSLSEEQRTALLENEKVLLQMAQEKTADSGNFFIRYVQNTTTGNYEPYLYAESELKQGNKYNNKNLASIPCYTLGETTQTREVLNKSALLEQDASGRYVAITIDLGTAMRDIYRDNTDEINAYYDTHTPPNPDDYKKNGLVPVLKNNQADIDGYWLNTPEPVQEDYTKPGVDYVPKNNQDEIDEYWATHLEPKQEDFTKPGIDYVPASNQEEVDEYIATHPEPKIDDYTHYIHDTTLSNIFTSATAGGNGCYDHVMNPSYEDRSGCYKHVIAHLIDLEIGEDHDDLYGPHDRIGANPAAYPKSGIATSVPGLTITIQSTDVTVSNISIQGKTESMVQVSDALRDGYTPSGATTSVMLMAGDVTADASSPEATKLLSDYYIKDGGGTVKQKLMSNYCLDASGDVTKKTLRQKAIDLFYLCDHLEELGATIDGDLVPAVQAFQNDMSDFTVVYNEQFEHDHEEWVTNTTVHEWTEEVPITVPDEEAFLIAYQEWLNGAPEYREWNDEIPITVPDVEAYTIAHNNWLNGAPEYREWYEDEPGIVPDEDAYNAALEAFKNGAPKYRSWTEQEEVELGTRSYKLTATTTTDEDAYNNAMNQYYYNQQQYEHKIQEINSKIEIIQQQDKNLELKLKQLDTEENAISTEIDAVKKVISKNVESSFKTFNA